MTITPEQATKLADYIKANYQPSHGSYTMWRSQGNYDDVFDDGVNLGEAVCLKRIADIIGLPVEALEQPDLP